MTKLKRYLRPQGINGQKTTLPGGSDKEFDYVITLGCQDTCPFVPAKDHIEWQINDPKGKGIESFRNVRDIIKSKVEELINNIKK